MIDLLLAPMRLPRRALENLDLLVDAARRLVRLQEAVLKHIECLEEQARSIGEDLAAAREQVGNLEHQVSATREAVDTLKAELKDLSEHLPDPDGPGPIARAREAITGGE